MKVRKLRKLLKKMYKDAPVLLEFRGSRILVDLASVSYERDTDGEYVAVLRAAPSYKKT